MTPVSCPVCSNAIALEDVNMSEGIGLCRPCGKVFRLAQVAHDPQIALAEQELRDGKVPSKCRIDDSQPGLTVIRAAARFQPIATFLLVFAAFWSAMWVLLLILALVGLPKTNESPHDQGSVASQTGAEAGALLAPQGRTVIPAGSATRRDKDFPLTYLLMPFGFAAVLLNTGAAAAWFGEYRVSLGSAHGPKTGTVFFGVGPIGWNRRFDVASVRSVTIGDSGVRVNGQPRDGVIIEADRTVKFGSTLSDERRRWMAAVLRSRLERSNRVAKGT